ncbi:hypothetical protein NDU88_003267 [Pleurodeles waltl]|uniref:Uncharacterized protein n=1 Tax=Pleurodeles waltl TaxID=8319 RepID=A0AAV7Q966_PLEWA|nr:hypothetical protein NDU88_003267 [Pleurodeles waltl]
MAAVEQRSEELWGVLHCPRPKLRPPGGVARDRECLEDWCEEDQSGRASSWGCAGGSSAWWLPHAILLVLAEWSGLRRRANPGSSVELKLRPPRRSEDRNFDNITRARTETCVQRKSTRAHSDTRVSRKDTCARADTRVTTAT